ncbi:MAG: hypothetical protein WBF89_21750 [Steroidobacteraceae bacterium]
MAIEAVFRHLTSTYAAMRDALQSLGLTAIEDRPPRDEVLLVERLGNLVEDLRGWTEEGCRAAAEAQEAIAHPADWHAVRGALAQANERLIVVEYRFFGDAVAYETTDALLRFGRQRGREWLGWSKSVVQALDACRAPLRALDEACLQAWQELGERLGARSVSLQTTNIGQQISAPLGRRPGVEAANDRRQDEFT